MWKKAPFTVAIAFSLAFFLFHFSWLFLSLELCTARLSPTWVQALLVACWELIRLCFIHSATKSKNSAERKTKQLIEVCFPEFKSVGCCLFRYRCLSEDENGAHWACRVLGSQVWLAGWPLYSASHLNGLFQGWKGSSDLNSACCFFRGLQFGLQNSYSKWRRYREH